MLINGRPILMHTLEAFSNCGFRPEIILVLHIEYHDYWESLCEKFDFKVPHKLAKAGTQRFDSVKNGLDLVSGNAIVAIHDAVRPLVSIELINNSFKTAEEFGTAVAAIPVRDSVRQGDNERSVNLNRAEIFMIQTPQTFESKILRKAYQQPYRNEFTDDASVVEKAGYAIRLIEGENKNLKVTYPEDIRIAELYLSL